MASILQTLSMIVTPDMLSGVGKQLGLSNEVTRQGLTISNALVAGGLARAAGSEAGAAQVAALVDKADTGVLGNLGALASSATGGSTTVTHQLFGNNYDLLLANVKKATGIDIKPLLALSAPMVLGAVKNLAGQQGLDQAGIAKLLQSELKGLTRQDAQTGKLVKELFKPLDAQDKVRARYSDAEWATLQAGPSNAAAVIMLADRSGGGGQSKEIEAMRLAVAEAVAGSAPTDLVNMLFRDGVSGSAVEELMVGYKKTDELTARKIVLNPVKAAMDTVRTKGGKGDAAAYQAVINATVQRVAGAAREGGFLGMGGSNVSDAEKEALDAIAAALHG